MSAITLSGRHDNFFLDFFPFFHFDLFSLFSSLFFALLCFLSFSLFRRICMSCVFISGMMTLGIVALPIDTCAYCVRKNVALLSVA